MVASSAWSRLFVLDFGCEMISNDFEMISRVQWQIIARWFSLMVGSLDLSTTIVIPATPNRPHDGNSFSGNQEFWETCHEGYFEKIIIDLRLILYCLGLVVIEKKLPQNVNLVSICVIHKSCLIVLSHVSNNNAFCWDFLLGPWL